MSIDVWKGKDQIPTPSIVRQPNVGTARATFVEQTVISLATSGNAYWRVYRNARGEVSNIVVLNPLDVSILQSTDGNGAVTGFAYKGKALKVEEVKHLALSRVPGSPYGLGPIQAARTELRGAMDVRDYAGNWFGQSDVPSGILSSDQHLTAEQAKEARDSWIANQAGLNGVAVLGAGLSYSPVFINPADAQWLEARRFNTTEIARLFGVPASLMLASLEGNSQTYSNVEQDWLGYVRFSLMAYLSEIEQAFTDLLPRGQEAKFNIDALLRSDTTTRYAAHKTALEARFLTVNEVRAIEGMPPIAGGDVLAPPAAPKPTEEVAND